MNSWNVRLDELIENLYKDVRRRTSFPSTSEIYIKHHNVKYFYILAPKDL